MGNAILIAVEDPAVLEALSIFLQGHEYRCTPARDAQTALSLLGRSRYDVLLCDADLGGTSGYDLAAKVRDEFPGTAVLILTPTADPKAPLLAQQCGAQDVVPRPLHLEDLLRRLRRTLSLRARATQFQPPGVEFRHPSDSEPLIGSSPTMGAVMQLIRRLSASASTVLITGESGTGKEIVARTLHDVCEATRDQNFVPINCAAIPPSLMESELFGHARGAFTGATSEKKGLFEIAEGGSLFLDEIGDLDLGLQAKLLRAIDRREIVRVGGVSPIRLSTRILCATNRDLRDWTARALFREDLFYRISVVEVHLPPLRERPEDIPDLAAHFIQKLDRELKRACRGVEPDAMELLQAYEWPGNVRELQNVIERALILGNGETIAPEDLPLHFARGPVRPAKKLREALRVFECEHIRSVLEEVGGDRIQAARRLGIGVSSLYRKLRKLKLVIPDHERPEGADAESPEEERRRAVGSPGTEVASRGRHAEDSPGALRKEKPGTKDVVNKVWERTRAVSRRRMAVPDEDWIDPPTRLRLRKHLVVCVDDDPETLNSLRRLLRNVPYQVLVTERPDEALQWVGSREVSLVLSDQRMPEMLGTHLLEEVSRRSPATTRFLLTAYHDSKEVVQAMGRTVHGVLEKPWDGRALRRTILALLTWREEKDHPSGEGAKN